jgi:CheY-like chemotaxis protein
MEIADGDLPAAMKRLARCRAGSKMAQELTVQLLAFSKGGAPVRILGAPAKAIQEAAELAVAGSSVRLECQFASDLWAVEHDAGQLGQVISNLVINAAQAMPDGGVVSLVAANVAGDGEGDENAWVRVEVKDSGIGIAQEIAKQIFDPYYTTKEGGRGLGLTTAYKIVSAHGGNLEFESVPGEGATFHFSLPARPRATLSEPAKELTPRLKPRRLLVMDDDGAVRTVARAFLERAGHDVVTVNEGQQAVKVYQEAMSHGQPFDLVILDLTVVEGQGGRETVRQLKLSDPRVRAIVSSGYSHDPVMSDYAAHGFIDVLPKPYSSVQLEAAVARVLWNGPT